MNAQGILDHHTGCKAKHDKECVEQEGQETGEKVTQEEVQVLVTEGGILVT